MASRAIVIREKGQTIPDEYLKLVLGANQSNMGLVFYDDKDKKIKFDRAVYNSENPPLSVAEFNEIQTAYKDFTTVHLFGQSEADLNEQDLQPYQVLLNAKGEPSVMMCLEGDFSSYTQAENTYSDEFFAANKYIIPLIKKWHANVGQDLGKLYNELNDPMNKTTLMNTATTRGAITMIVEGFTGALTFDKNAGGSQFPWGWVSNTYDYTEKPAQAPKAEAAPSGGGMLSRRRNLSSSSAPAPGPAPALPDMKPKPDNVEGPVLPNPKTDVAAAQAEVVESGEHEMITPPKEVMGKMLKSWYSRECEFVPQNWFERPAAPKKRIVKDFKELKPIAETKSISQPAAGPKEPKDATFLINPDKIKMVQSIVTVDRNSQQMSVDVKQLQAIEAKGPSALDAIGAEQDAMDYRPLEVFVAVGKQDLNFLARLAFDMRNRALQAEHDLDLATKPAVETKETQAAPAGGMLRRRRLSA